MQKVQSCRGTEVCVCVCGGGGGGGEGGSIRKPQPAVRQRELVRQTKQNKTKMSLLGYNLKLKAGILAVSDTVT